MGFLTKVFGTHSERELKLIYPLVDKIEALRPEMMKLSDEELKGKTREFKQRLADGETLDDLLVEAFAAVREAARRVLGMEHYRVQLIGGIILHQGRIAEMKTGEGKTLVSTLPAYLNALEGKGVHIVTVNDYLAHRDAEWMGKVHEALGLTVGVVLNGNTNDERRAAYACDITLFDRKRGSGESIWDIKRHIGYVSPEMYRSFLRHIPAIQIVANGFFDTAGITRNPGPDQLATAEFWMKIFRIDRLKDRFFTELSSGEQHLCLLARAFVKDPELLILDEPLHCLDERNSILAKDIITAFCQRRNKTLIMVSHYQENFPGIIDRRLTLERKE